MALPSIAQLHPDFVSRNARGRAEPVAAPIAKCAVCRCALAEPYAKAGNISCVVCLHRAGAVPRLDTLTNASYKPGMRRLHYKRTKAALDRVRKTRPGGAPPS